MTTPTPTAEPVHESMRPASLGRGWPALLASGLATTAFVVLAYGVFTDHYLELVREHVGPCLAALWLACAFLFLRGAEPVVRSLLVVVALGTAVLVSSLAPDPAVRVVSPDGDLVARAFEPRIGIRSTVEITDRDGFLARDHPLLCPRDTSESYLPVIEWIADDALSLRNEGQGTTTVQLHGDGLTMSGGFWTVC